jgi:hypothetical protein
LVVVPAFLGGKVGAGVAVGSEGGACGPEFIQVFLGEYLVEAGGAVKV